ncbi:GNAT family N-acetyltransferase [Candidatus Mcinerneyibacteriota bacterium]|nr:GNAT family N-acetyltransferase [Candidatus Mcinerneyibacteriota bacterium]
MNSNAGKLKLPIETPRLLLSLWEEEDFEGYWNLCRESAKGNFFEGWAMNREKAVDFFRWQRSKYEKMDPVTDIIGLAVIEKESGSRAGHVSVGRHGLHDETEISYGLLPSYRGKGYATEACSALTEWAFSHFSLSYIIGTAPAENSASCRVLEKSGFTFVRNEMEAVPLLGRSLLFTYWRKYRETA